MLRFDDSKTMKSNDKQSLLRHNLSLFDAVSINIGAIIGAGIFVVSGIVAGLAGSAMIISLMLAALVSLFTALTFAELSAKYPKEGGAYEFAHQLISPFTGFIAGWMWVISNTFVGAAVALGFAHYLAALIPATPIKFVAIAITIVFTIVNILGAKTSATLNNILVIAKVTILLLFVILGIFHINTVNLTPFTPFKPGVLFGAYFIFFAFSGFARITLLSEEVKDAHRNVPKAILLSLLISTIVYITVGIVAVGLVGPARLANSASPLAEASSAIGISVIYQVVSIGGIIATASVLLTTILGVSRLSFAMAREKDLPSFLKKLDSKYGSPYPAIIVSSIIMVLLIFVSNLTQIVAVSTLASLIYYGIGNVSALKLNTKDRLYPRIVPFAGLISCAAFAVIVLFKSPQAWVIGTIIIMIGVLYYLLVTRRVKTWNMH
jgi:APA family basic amino acid/polyamine antiporter